MPSLDELVAASTADVGDDELVRLAEQRGYIIHRPQPPEAITLDLNRIRGRERVRLAIVSCTHFGSKYQQPTALAEFVAYARRRKVDYFVHAGDVTDGPFGRHRNPQEVFLHDFGRIVDYTADKLPRAPWVMISGNHDDWWTSDGGPDIVAAIAGERSDIEYLGRSQGYLGLGAVSVEILHENKGSAYAYSYRLQKHIESLAPNMKPAICLLGNYHKFCAVYYRNTLGLQLPSFQAQTPWMAQRSLVSEVGGVILEVGLANKGIAPSARWEIIYDYEPRENDWP